MTIERREIPTPEVRQIGAPEDRTLRFRVSDESVDRHNTRLMADGWKFDTYLKNPVVLWRHEADGLPVGRMTGLHKVTENGQRFVDGDVQFAPKDVYPFADLIYRMCKGGFLRGGSAGFTTLKQRSITDIAEAKKLGFREGKPAADLLENELMEFSIVPIPSNKNTLVATLKKETPEFAVRGIEDIAEADITQEWVAEKLEAIRSAMEDATDAAEVEIGKDADIRAMHTPPAAKAKPAAPPAPAPEGAPEEEPAPEEMGVEDAMDALVNGAEYLQEAATSMGRAHAFLEALMEMDGEDEPAPEEEETTPAPEGAAPATKAAPAPAPGTANKPLPGTLGGAPTNPNAGKMLVIGKFKELRLKIKRKGRKATAKEMEDGTGPMRAIAWQLRAMEERFAALFGGGVKKSELENLSVQVQDLADRLSKSESRDERASRDAQNSSHRDAIELALEGKAEQLNAIRGLLVSKK